MTDTDHPANGAPSWWPPSDTPPTNGNVVAAPFPPMPPDPPPPPPPPPPAATPPATTWPAEPPTADVAVPDVVPGRARTDRVRAVKEGAHRNRRWIAVAGVTIFAAAGLNWWATNVAHQVGAGVSEPLTAFNENQANMIAQIASSKSAPSQVSVQQPLSWLNCPVTPDARTMIGLDPNTQYATLDPGRAADVETQVRAYVVDNPLASLRITAASDSRLSVTVGGTKGVPLVDCSAGATQRQGGDTATTVAPR